jgi:hypothetical protein
LRLFFATALSIAVSKAACADWPQNYISPQKLRIARRPLRSLCVVEGSCDRPGSDGRKHRLSGKFADAAGNRRYPRNRLFRGTESSRPDRGLGAGLKMVRRNGLGSVRFRFELDFGTERFQLFPDGYWRAHPKIARFSNAETITRSRDQRRGHRAFPVESGPKSPGSRRAYQDDFARHMIVAANPTQVPEDFTGSVFSSEAEKADALDKMMNNVYQAVRCILPPSRFAKVKQEQIAWLKTRDAAHSGRGEIGAD